MRGSSRARVTNAAPGSIGDMRMLPLALLATVLLAAGCGDDDPAPEAPTSPGPWSPTRVRAASPACPESLVVEADGAATVVAGIDGARAQLQALRRELEQLRSELDAADFESVEDPPSPPTCADCYVYEIVYDGTTISYDDANPPAESVTDVVAHARRDHRQPLPARRLRTRPGLATRRRRIRCAGERFTRERLRHRRLGIHRRAPGRRLVADGLPGARPGALGRLGRGGRAARRRARARRPLRPGLDRRRRRRLRGRLPPRRPPRPVGHPRGVRRRQRDRDRERARRLLARRASAASSTAAPRPPCSPASRCARSTRPRPCAPTRRRSTPRPRRSPSRRCAPPPRTGFETDGPAAAPRLGRGRHDAAAGVRRRGRGG